jgi:hypothetical protein
MDKFINLKLMANPLNWATLALWLFAGAMVLAGAGITLAPTQTNTPPTQ